MRAVGVMDFAGSFAAGVMQAGFQYIAKREPSEFKGFGVASIEENVPGVQVEVTEPEFWSIVKSEMVFGCPPCSGFSMLSTINTADSKSGRMVDGVRVSQRGVDSPDNIWLWKLMDYAVQAKPEIVIIESVQSGGKLGAPLMRALWQKLRDESGVDYHMTDVFMNAALIGGDVIRPRYFLVLHTRPFGIDLPKGTPLPIKDVVGDLGEEVILDDPAWGHVGGGSLEGERVEATIKLFREHDYDWAQGKRLPEHLKYWYEDMEKEIPDWWFKKDGSLLSHAYSDNMYTPFRWRWEKPMGVVTGGFMDRAVHPIFPRLFTYREGARFMGFPDSWSLRPIVEGRNGSWLGKAIPVPSGRWISTAAANMIEGNPGEYAGVPVEPKHRVIDVSNLEKVRAIERGHYEDPSWWPDVPRRKYDYTPLGRGEGRPPSSTLPSRTSVQSSESEETEVKPTELKLTELDTKPNRKFRSNAEQMTNLKPTEPKPKRKLRSNKSAEQMRGRPRIVARRIPPEVFAEELLILDMSRKEAAEALDVTGSRIAELCAGKRPVSWLNADRWEQVRATLRSFRNA